MLPGVTLYRVMKRVSLRLLPLAFATPLTVTPESTAIDSPLIVRFPPPNAKLWVIWSESAPSLYYILARGTTKSTVIFITAGLVFTLVSFAGPLGSSLPDGTPTPDGFAGLTLPMHIVAGLAAVVVIPSFVRRKNV